MQFVRALEAVGKFAASVGIIGGSLWTSLYTVNGGERAIMFHRTTGVGKDLIGEGTHFRVPFFQWPIVYDVRIRPRTIHTTTGTKDLQTVQISLRLLYRPDEKHLSELYTVYGEDYEERVLPSLGNEVMKQIVAMFEASELITNREEVSNSIRKMLVGRCKEFHIAVEDVAITHLAFGKEFTAAIERKQEAERVKFVVEKDKLETNARVIRAEGEAIAAQMISEALKSGPGLIELRRLEAAKEIAETLAQSRNVTYIPGGGSSSSPAAPGMPSVIGGGPAILLNVPA